MSAFGTKRTSKRRPAMSAFGGKADINGRQRCTVLHNAATSMVGYVVCLKGRPVRRRDFITWLGGVTAWPLSARAQQKSLPVIGFMSSRSPEDSQSVLTGFPIGLSEGGVVEGKDAVIDFRWARGDFGKLPALAAELVRDRVAVIMAAGAGPPA